MGVNSGADDADAPREESNLEEWLLRFYNFYSQLQWWKIGWKTSYKCILFLSVFTSSWIIDVLVSSHLSSKTVARTTRPPWTRTGCGLVLAICTSSLQPPVCATECKYLSGPLSAAMSPSFTYRLSSTFTASKPSSGLGLRRGFNLSSASRLCLLMCLCLLFSFSIL